MIGDGTKNFRKYQLAVWLSIQNFYSHFTKVTRKCKCFGHNVEPCNNISAISWQSVLWVEETGVPWGTHRLAASQWQILSHNVVSSTPHHERDSNSQPQTPQLYKPRIPKYRTEGDGI